MTTFVGSVAIATFYDVRRQALLVRTVVRCALHIDHCLETFPVMHAELRSVDRTCAVLLRRMHLEGT